MKGGAEASLIICWFDIDMCEDGQKKEEPVSSPRYILLQLG